MNDVTNVELKCSTCGHDLVFTPKGLTCPVCEVEKKLVVKKVFLGFRAIKAVNVLLDYSFLSIEQLRDIETKGVKIEYSY